MSKAKFDYYSQYLLLSMHLAGIVGFILLPNWFWKLTWFNLVLSSILVLLYSKQRINEILLPFSIAFGIGFLVEVIGVKTGFPFGNYYYGSAFGIKLFAVPILIGVNWAIMNYYSSQVIKKLKIKNLFVNIILVSALMTMIDLIIEQICMHYQFWFFEGGKAGISNYVAWFITSLIISYFTFQKFANHHNRLSIYLFFYQLLFFICLNLYHFLK
jgi:bisanhydrobacterioruberin hydratase